MLTRKFREKNQWIVEVDGKKLDETKVNYCIGMDMSSTSFMVFNITYTICEKDLNHMPRGFKVSRPLIINMILCVSTNKVFQVKKYLHYDKQRSALEHLKMMVLCFIMQGKDVIERKCHVFYILVCTRKIFLSILMPSVICVHFS